MTERHLSRTGALSSSPSLDYGYKRLWLWPAYRWSCMYRYSAAATNPDVAAGPASQDTDASDGLRVCNSRRLVVTSDVTSPNCVINTL